MALGDEDCMIAPWLSGITDRMVMLGFGIH